MRIAITGAMGVGKTTLAHQVQELRPTFMILPEAARLAAGVGFRLDKDAGLDTEIWLLAKQLELEKHEGPWIADRCLFDLSAYIYHLMGEDQPFMSVVRRVTLKHANYDLVLYLPAGEFPIEEDGLRSTDLEFQKEIDANVKAYLDYFKVPYHTITGSREERLQRAIDLIDGKNVKILCGGDHCSGMFNIACEDPNHPKPEPADEDGAK